MTVDYLGFAYAVTVAAGGIIGYVKAGCDDDFAEIMKLSLPLKFDYCNVEAEEFIVTFFGVC